MFDEGDDEVEDLDEALDAQFEAALSKPEPPFRESGTAASGCAGYRRRLMWRLWTVVKQAALVALVWTIAIGMAYLIAEMLR